MDNDPLRLLNIDEVCELFRLKKDFVYDWTQAGRIPHLKFGRNVVRFRRSELEAFLDAHSVPSEVPAPAGIEVPTEFPSDVTPSQSDMRRWARSRGYEVSARGQVSKELLELYINELTAFEGEERPTATPRENEGSEHGSPGPGS